MSKDELIAKQQLEIEELKESSEINKETIKILHGRFYGIGQPLNDNKLKMDLPQLTWCSEVKNLIDRLRLW